MSIAPISPVEPPEAPAPPARESILREVLFALLAAVVVAGLGAPFGWLWSKLAPHVELVQTQYGPYPIDPEPEGYWADDGWFILMAIAMGAIVAVAAWFLLRRYRGPVMLLALVLGSTGASVLAAWLGNKIGWSHYMDLAEHAPENTHMFRPVKLRTGEASLWLGFIPWVRGTMLIQGIAAAAVYTGLAGFHVSPTLRYDNIPPEYLTPAPPAPGVAAYAPQPGYSYPPPGAAHPAEYPPAGFPSGADQAAAYPPPSGAPAPAHPADAPHTPPGSDTHAAPPDPTAPPSDLPRS
ncbi:DUF2567 domain-containing protein [Dactylosporangium matsuzakiense]|uniref:DUF2567 domain-containing protein n=1 Tax=Dactylosporangium matsuzakiense TaxID=53360 RepID=A0A9W6KP87_9ACTN|nr:DUF2567 domain-containing protein [Dactylosporangium matsuzakiense]UWZ43341.1 DUF2567 domain-containing protein [Dactylosporangium matsuzakiense]GLL05063.1 hypothetical protein GCM10017581_068100 [Dactylosporangium matsuzakiense]